MKNKYKIASLLFSVTLLLTFFNPYQTVSASTSGSTSDGTLLVNGQPFFSIRLLRSGMGANSVAHE